MREKELRLALVCYGGISLAVYMHGITKEVWRLACASRAFHDGRPCTGSQDVYRQLLARIEEHAGLRLSVFADIVAGASAGGINGIFLAQAIASGQSLDPLTDLWLEGADVETLIDPEAKATRLSKLWAIPIAMLADRGGEAMETVDPDTRAEVRRKLSSFVRARWFEPPFGGETFTGLLLDALDAMARTPAGPPLLPDDQPLDLFRAIDDVLTRQMHGDFDIVPAPAILAGIDHRGPQRAELDRRRARRPELHGAIGLGIVGESFEGIECHGFRLCAFGDGCAPWGKL